MMKFFFSIILIFCAPFMVIANDCTINLKPQVLLSNDFAENDLRTIIINNTCNEQTTSSITKAISTYSGIVKTKYLAQIVSTNEKLRIFPNQIDVIKISSFIRDQLYDGNKDIFITKLKLFSTFKVFGFSKDQLISVNCVNCSNYGDKNIELNIKNIKTGLSQTYWLKATIKTITRVLTPTKHLSLSSSSIKASDFVFKSILTTDPTSFFSNKKQLKYYRLNKTVIKGNALKNSDISPLFLVQPGNLAELVFDNGSIKLASKAYPKQRARYGETIKLTHPKNGKLISGKVIGKNKVLVQI